MGRIPDDIIQQIRDRVDIVDLIGRHVSLKKTGRSYKGLCPFHSEKTPSFHVNPDRQSYYCFGCHEGGSVITFLMQHENQSFPEAVRSLARDVGIEIPETGHPGQNALGERIFAATDAAQELYRRALGASESRHAAEYLTGRGLDADDIARFGIGFAPDAWDFVGGALRQKGIPTELAERAGLVGRSESGRVYDRLRGRITFPIRDARGRVIGFGGRATRPDQQPKYYNTPESPVFHKRQALYGIPEALGPMRKNDCAVVVEGYFDQIALVRAGTLGAVATCGTALTDDHARYLRRQVRTVVVLFDGDEAGQRAIERSLEVLLPHGVRVRAAVLPPGEDPDSFLAGEGAEALRALVEEAPAAIDFAIRRAVSRGVGTAWEKADAVSAVTPLLALISDGIEQGEYALQLAAAVGTETRHVENAVRATRRGDEAEAREAVPVAARRSGPEERVVRQLVRSLVEHPELAARVPRDELLTLVPMRPLAVLVETLLEAAGEARPVDLDELGERLGDEARSLLRSLSADDEALEEGVATRTLDDALRWLRRQRRREAKRQTTQRMRAAGADHDALLREKQEQLAEQKDEEFSGLRH